MEDERQIKYITLIGMDNVQNIVWIGSNANLQEGLFCVSDYRKKNSEMYRIDLNTLQSGDVLEKIHDGSMPETRVICAVGGSFLLAQNSSEHNTCILLKLH